MKRLNSPAWILAACAAVALSACGGGDPKAAVSGTVTGLAAGTTVDLQENQSTVLSVSGSSTFEFPGTLPANAAYSVTVASQPAGETCTVANGSGTMDGSGDPVNNIVVTCVPGASVGGTVTGLSDGTALTLTDGSTSLPVTASGSFAFSDLYASAATYAVSVAAQPSGQQCTVSNGSGALDANGDPVNNVMVTCAAAPALSGTLAGLAPNATVTLSDGTSQQSVTANGSFGFADSFAPGAAYQVSVSTQPDGQTCSVANAGGAFDMTGDAISNVTVTCTTNGTVGGTVTGLAANGSVALSDGTTTLTLTANGPFTFPEVFAPGTTYAVTVPGQPSGQTCTALGGSDSGTVDASDDAVTNVSIACN